jgi:nucleoside-diphosphate-sugar epimerase
MNSLFVFGLGYSSTAIALNFLEKGWKVSGTVRSEEKISTLKNLYPNLNIGLFQNQHWIKNQLQLSSHILVSIPPQHHADPTLPLYARHIINAKPSWIGYLSSTVVYGDHKGAWVDEQTTPSPSAERGQARLQAEQQWQQIAENNHTLVDIFRLAGIYGPHRNALASLTAHKAKKIIKKNQIFSRIHRDDIVAIVSAAIQKPQGLIYNGSDNLPAPPWEVIAYAETCLGLQPLPDIPFENANLSPQALSFYQDNKRVRSDFTQKTLNISLAYPSYKEGLDALFAQKAF